MNLSWLLEPETLPFIFAAFMGLSMLIYAILDGYDLGVGMLINNANWHEKDLMIASIGPFWDANETWLILGVGLLLTAFPAAHGIILTKLYIPVAIMLFGLIFRGVAFDFRAKAPYKDKWKWNNKFFQGSLLTSLAQGYMLGSYIIGFDQNWSSIMFSCLVAVALSSAYCLIGACWLIIKCEGSLQIKAISWARYHLISSVIGLITISIVTPLVSERILKKWFSMPEILYLSPIPLIIIFLVIGLFRLLNKLPLNDDKKNWLPFLITVSMYILSFVGLAYSFYPYIVPNKMTILEAASATASLKIILIGIVIIFPMLIGYTILSYYIFSGKATELKYD